jgi:uncharacterized membrane protein
MSVSTTLSSAVGRQPTGADRLDLPMSRTPRRAAIVPLRRVDREAAGRVAEVIARFLGTARYLAIQTVVVVVWIGLNIAIPFLRWDPYPFILLNLAFSTQAAYAAPLILLAQNRQDDRDRAALAEDRHAAGRVRDDTEFLAREMAALRLTQADTATRNYLRGEMAHQLESLRDDIRDDLRADLTAILRAVLAETPTPAPASASASASVPTPASAASTAVPAPAARPTTANTAVPRAARAAGAETTVGTATRPPICLSTQRNQSDTHIDCRTGGVTPGSVT